MKVRVKYCGGCNPRFDRKAVTERLKAGFPRTEFVEMGDDDGPFDHVVVICGCPAECTSHENVCGLHGKTVVSSLEESEELEKILQAVPRQG